MLRETHIRLWSGGVRSDHKWSVNMMMDVNARERQTFVGSIVRTLDGLTPEL